MTKKNRFRNDNREQENSNPDRPPIEPGQPERPAPFDPFSTPQIPDGGTTVRDTTESVFDAAISKTTPTTDSPATPSIDAGSTSQLPEDGTLIKYVRDFVTFETDFEYVLQKETTGFNHVVIDGNELRTRIQHTKNGFLIEHKHRIDGETVLSTNECETFDVAMASMIEAIDWGSLPPGDNTPEIWEYNGFDNNAGTFEDYLTGTTNKECGDHVFVNTAAEYEIIVENYADKRLHADNTATICIVTIQTTEQENNVQETIFRERFNGQKEALEFIVENLDNGLSKELALQEKQTGDERSIPTITELQTRD